MAPPPSPPAETAEPSAVLDFWFTPEAQRFWFERSEAFDAAVTERLLPLWQPAREGRIDGWTATPDGTVALLVLLDQVPRNCFRNSPLAFSTDAKARGVARQAVDRGFDKALPTERRLFVYMPFEHSEDLGTQVLSMVLFHSLHDGDAEKMKWAARHEEIIRRFGRFPHRNACLGRVSTAEEIAFLREPMSSF